MQQADATAGAGPVAFAVSMDVSLKPQPNKPSLLCLGRGVTKTWLLEGNRKNSEQEGNDQVLL